MSDEFEPSLPVGVSGGAIRAGEPMADAAAQKPRVWPALIIIALQWAALILPTRLAPGDMLAFYGFVVGTFGGLAAILVWWLFFSRVRWVDVAIVLLAVALGLAAVQFAGLDSVQGLSITAYVAPMVTTAIVVWLAATPFLSWSVRRAGIFFAVFAACGYFASTRVDGMNGIFSAAWLPRWQLTDEERFLIGAAPDLAAEPRFALESGLELRYAVKLGTWFDGKDGKPDITREADGSPKYQKSDLTIYVLGRQPEGSFRVLMQRTSATGSPLITWADLFPGGQLTLIPLAMPILESESLRTIFPLLPKDEREKSDGWAEVEPSTDLRMRFAAAGGIIKAECDGPLDRVSKGRWSIRYRLDSKTNLPDQILTDGRWDTYKETHSVVIVAKETIRHDEAWVAKFTANAAKYFEATAKYDRAHQREVVALAIAEREKPGAAEEMLDARKAILIAARDAVTEPMFRADLERSIKQCDEYRKSRVEGAQSWAKIAGLPAPEWKVADLGGMEHSLMQCRGQVVVLDFWFRQCSFCIRAMPQVEQAAATFRQEMAPVSFFGVSIDKDEADAKFVADTMNLRYPVLRSEKLAEQFGVTGYPTLLVIAPDSTVQGIFIGHSVTLREELTACVRGLLKK